MNKEAPNLESEPVPTEKERELAAAMIKALSDNDPEFFHDLAGEMVEEPSPARDMKSDDEQMTVKELYSWTKEVVEKKGDVSPMSESADVGENDKVKDMIRRARDEMLDESREHYTNVRKDTPREVFYRVLAEDYPQLGFSVSEEASNKYGEKLDDYVEVKSKPYESDKEFVFELSSHPVIDVLTRNIVMFPDKEESGRELEEKGMIPKGTVDRLLAWWGNLKVEESSDPSEDYEKATSEAGVAPLTKDELKNMIRRVIDKEIEEKQGI